MHRIRGGRRARAAFLAALLAAAACGGSAPGPAPAGDPDPNQPNSPTRGVNEPRHIPAEYVVMVSFDGFRHDYLELYDTPAFDRVIERGAWAEGLLPPFPSLTFPSHYTLATGLWPESHGLIGNRFFDPVRDDDFNYRDPEDATDGSWYGGEPIWSTAEKQGMVAASYFWVGSEAEIAGARPSHWYEYDGSVRGADKVDQVLEWLALPEERRPHMITLYFPDTDGAGHANGPLSAEVEAAVARVDRWLDRLIRGISLLPHGERVNLVLVSDHGMTRAPASEAVLVDLSDTRGARFVGGGAVAWIFAPDGAGRRERDALQASIRAQLPEDVDVYLREDLPDDLHLSATDRAGDVVIVPPLGVSVLPAGAEPRDRFSHGWRPDDPEMWGIFVASGPAIREGARLRAFSSVHVYPFVAELLGLEAPEVDGSLEVLGDLIQR